jgi:hypothetical protein
VGGQQQKGNMKLNRVEKKYYELITASACRDLQKVSKKYMNYKLPNNYNHLRKMPFYMMMSEGMHYILEQGNCVHTLNEMIKDAKKTAIDYEKQKLKE